MEELIKQHAQIMGVSVEEIKLGILRLLPFLEMAAGLTTNKYDDLVVDLLKRMVA